MRRINARMGNRRALLCGALLCLSAGAVSGCGVAGRAGAQTPESTGKVTERDFHIKAPKQAKAGELRLSVENDGPDQHELIVVRQGSKPLPFRRDGMTIDEDAIERSKAGGLEPGAPQSRRTLEVDLKPGRYVLFCNMYGHYLAGMHTQLVVR